MKKLIAAFGFALCVSLSGQAQATCAIFCDATLADESCDPTFTFETDERIGAFGECEVQCCAPPSPEFPNGDCSTDVEPLSPDLLQIMDSNFNPVEAFFLNTGAMCGDYPLMVTDRSLDEGIYLLNAGFETVGDFEVVADTGSGGCDSTGGSEGSAAGLAAMALMGLGLVRRRS